VSFDAHGFLSPTTGRVRASIREIASSELWFDFVDGLNDALLGTHPIFPSRVIKEPECRQACPVREGSAAQPSRFERSVTGHTPSLGLAPRLGLSHGPGPALCDRGAHGGVATLSHGAPYRLHLLQDRPQSHDEDSGFRGTESHLARMRGSTSLRRDTRRGANAIRNRSPRDAGDTHV
jgi:hypothetical protein